MANEYTQQNPTLSPIQRIGLGAYVFGGGSPSEFMNMAYGGLTGKPDPIQQMQQAVQQQLAVQSMVDQMNAQRQAQMVQRANAEREQGAIIRPQQEGALPRRLLPSEQDNTMPRGGLADRLAQIQQSAIASMPGERFTFDGKKIGMENLRADLEKDIAKTKGTESAKAEVNLIEQEALGPIEAMNTKLKEEAKQEVVEKPSDKLVSEAKETISNLSAVRNGIDILSNNWDDLSGVMGPTFTGAPLMRTIARYSDNATVNTFLSGIQQGVNAYRKAITGAQASVKEIKWLKDSYPSENDKPISFVGKSLRMALAAKSAADKEINILKKANRSTAYMYTISDMANDDIRSIGNLLYDKSPSDYYNIIGSFKKQFPDTDIPSVPNGELDLDNVFQGLQ